MRFPLKFLYLYTTSKRRETETDRKKPDKRKDRKHSDREKKYERYNQFCKLRV